MNDSSGRPAELFRLIDAYCAGVIDDEGLRRLEAILLADPNARRAFVEYSQLDAELHFMTWAKTATTSALSLVGPTQQPRRSWVYRRRLAVAASIFITAGALATGLGVFRRSGSRPIGNENVAWLVNAQDCLWVGGEKATPGRDMRVGKMLRLERGLAEIEFRSRRPPDPTRPGGARAGFRQRRASALGRDDGAGAAGGARVHDRIAAGQNRRPRHRVRPGGRRPGRHVGACVQGGRRGRATGGLRADSAPRRPGRADERNHGRCSSPRCRSRRPALRPFDRAAAIRHSARPLVRLHPCDRWTPPRSKRPGCRPHPPPARHRRRPGHRRSQPAPRCRSRIARTDNHA